MTLGRRVVLATSLAIGVVAVLISVFAYVLVQHELYHRVDVTLEDRAAAIAPAVASTLPGAGSLPIVASPGELVQVLRADGTTTRPPYQASTLPSGARERAVALAGGSLAETAAVGGARMRVLTTELGRKVALQVARPLASEDAALHRLRWVLAVLAASALLVSLLLGGWIARTALAPVRRLTSAAESVARTRDLSLRLDESGHDEVARLGAAFNQMLAALERSLTAQRRLVADASHEFRTPLTSLRANAELLERGADEAERAEMLHAVVEQVDELDGLVTDLIELALDGEPETAHDDVDLDRVVEHEVERMRRHAPAVTFALTAEPAVVSGDAERMARAVSNVLANAVKWSPPGSTIDVSLAGATLTVRDRGPGIDEADLPFVFERFYRSPAARGMPGSGLGLAIVRHVAEAHGGGVEAANAPGGGAVITVRFA